MATRPTASDYRLHARQVIAGVLAALPPDATPQQRRRAVRAAYPFREKTGWAYKCWLREAAAALGPVRRERHVGVTPDGVSCPHCDRRPDGFRSRGGCLLCHAAWAAYRRLPAADLAAWRGMLADGGGAARAALADWIQDHGLGAWAG
jgi:hypothetical protein